MKYLMELKYTENIDRVFKLNRDETNKNMGRLEP